MKKKPIRYKCANNVTWWLVDLPPGEYTATYISEITGQSRPNVYTRMKALKVERILIPQENKNLKPRVVYAWKGVKHYSRSLIKEQQQDVLSSENDTINN